MYNQIAKLVIMSCIVVSCITLDCVYNEALAQKNDSGGKQATETELNEGIEEATKTISELTKKVYAKSLFSPKDNDKLIGLKITLYKLWEKNPSNRQLAEPLYNTAILLQKRELYEEAIDILNIVVESYPPFEEEEEEETISVDYSSKAQEVLKKIKQKLLEK